MRSPALLRIGTAYLAVTAVLVEVIRLRVPAVRRGLASVVPVYREREGRRPSGAMWLAVGYAVAAWLPPPAAVAGILAGALADPAGAVVGTRFGRGARKSLPGTLAVALTALLAALAVGVPWPAALGAGVTGAAAERWSGPVDDNLVVAPAVALLVTLLA